MKIFEFNVKVTSVEMRRQSFSVGAETEKEAREKIDKIMEENSGHILNAKFDVDENDTDFILIQSYTQPPNELMELDCMGCETTFKSVDYRENCPKCTVSLNRMDR